jgi:hypothetical protein
MGLDGGELCVGTGGELGLKSVLEHGRVCGRGEVKGRRMAGLHEGWKLLAWDKQGYHGGQKAVETCEFCVGGKRRSFEASRANILKQNLLR